jgi:hypothetical protein
MKKIFKSKLDIVFWTTALVFIIFMVGFTAFSLQFAAARLNTVFRPEQGGEELIVRFDFDKLNRIFPGATTP